MHAKYYVIMFALCFCVWTILIDNLILPSKDHLRQDNGAYTRYRVKHWNKGGKFKVVEDELLIYAVVKNREQLYYMEYKPYFEASLKNLPNLTPVHLRYVRAFPKFWKRHLYDLQVSGRSAVTYSAYTLHQKQQENWKITGIMGGIYAIIVVLGLLNKPR